MNTVRISTATKGHRMIDRADTEASLARVAFAAFLYHPTKHLDEPGWTVDEDIDWALTPLNDLDPTARAVWRERIREVIIFFLLHLNEKVRHGIAAVRILNQVQNTLILILMLMLMRCVRFWQHNIRYEP